MRIYTCTPRDFPEDRNFFNRDSGLFCRGLEVIGVESRAIGGGERRAGDHKDLIRASLKELESTTWWERHHLDGLILYSWAAPEFNGVARAIRDAGIPFLVVMDTCGMISRFTSPRDWWREGHVRKLAGKRGILEYVIKGAEWLGGGLLSRVPRRRIDHYDAATRVAVVTPLGSIWVPGEARAFGRDDLVERFCYLPHPQPEWFFYDGTPKENLVISVGRWRRRDWKQKNPGVLVPALKAFLERRPDWSAMIVGADAEELAPALGMDPGSLPERLRFRNAIPQQELVALYRRAKIGFWTSRWEGQQGTGAQALCCGCSVVGPFSASMSCFRHYVSKGSGRLARWNEPAAMSDELHLEAEAWESGDRDPDGIGRMWTREFHSPEVARRAVMLLGLDRM